LDLKDELNLREKIEGRVLVGDGATGTLLAEHRIDNNTQPII
jgi:methionine synthase I (cobalamin-dependent)